MTERKDDQSPGGAGLRSFVHIPAAERHARTASRKEIEARRGAQLLREAPPPTAEPTPHETPFLTAAEALTWIAYGEARPKERAAPDSDLFAFWGVSAAVVDQLLDALETGVASERLYATPDQTRDWIQEREGRRFTFPELADRLRDDRVKLNAARDLLASASQRLVKACIDGELQAFGRPCADERDAAIPVETFFQDSVEFTWFDTIAIARGTRWEKVRFRYSDIMRLWPATDPAAPVTQQAAGAAQIAPPSEKPQPTNAAAPTSATQPVSASSPAAADAPAQVAPASKKPEPTNPAVKQWIKERITAWPANLPAPSEDADWTAAQDHFAPGLRRDPFRELRNAMVPPEWRKQGPRPPWGQVKSRHKS